MPAPKRPNVNALGLKLYPLHRLKVGKSALLGPYTAAKTVGTIIARVRQRPGCDQMGFLQRKMILLDPVTGESVFMWVVTRVN